MSNDAHRFMVAYDIVNDKRRSHLAVLLQSYGFRVQYSLFQIDAKPARMERLFREIEEMVSASEDSVIVLDLGVASSVENDKVKRIGGKRNRSIESAMVF